MANICDNTLSIYGDISLIRNKILNKDNELDFGILKPVPFMMKIDSWNTDVFLLKWIKELKGESFSNKVKGLYNIVKRVAKAYSYNIIYFINNKIYGSKDWYEFQIANWGCKWNANDTSIIESEDSIVIHFTTPRSPPITYYDTLYNVCCKLNLHMSATYYEPGMGFYGSYEDGQDYESAIDNYYYSDLLDKYVVSDDIDDVLADYLSDTIEVEEALKLLQERLDLKEISLEVYEEEVERLKEEFNY